MTQHVCIVSNTLADGGAERWASNTCTFLAKAGLRVSLVLFRDIRTYPCPESVSVMVLGHRHFGHTLFTVRRLRRLLIGEKADIVISNGSFTGQFVGQAMRGTNSRWIARISGNIAKGQETFLQRLGWRWLNSNIARSSAIVANSQSMADETIARWPGLAERVCVIPNGVDLNYLARASADESAGIAPEERPMILAAGRLHPQKRPDLFVEALRLLKTRFEFNAIWCGDGPLRETTERQIKACGLEEEVKTVGFQAKLPRWIALASCFVMTSDHEGSPNVLAEAMALATPVVSTDCPHGPKELLAESRGWLTPVGAPDQVAAAIAEVLSQPNEARLRANRAQAWIQENLDLQSVGERWKGLIAEEVSCFAQSSVRSWSRA